ncbi:hypothetical protein G9U51_06835 [Calidifontibacter sp. DB0510]|uniref:Uncharacterized protein n=1 Tax=Metallococcus carri TaxID=1656884 RepID=A0A967B1D9_9MICO|nr:hypothetical protein [Metallococcus carri]NOP38321.1 hypothetical protein [Calidifontibacter sp. DB2511S]
MKGTKKLVVDVKPAHLTKDEGNFTFGYCESCAWRGPGRRSRDKARDDAQAHEGACTKGHDVTLATGRPK